MSSSHYETAKENDLDPYQYLLWLLQNAPGLSETDEAWAEKLLPANAGRMLYAAKIDDRHLSEQKLLEMAAFYTWLDFTLTDMHRSRCISLFNNYGQTVDGSAVLRDRFCG